MHGTENLKLAYSTTKRFLSHHLSLWVSETVRALIQLNPTSALMQLWCMIDKAYLQNCKIVTYLNSVAKYVSDTKVFALTFLALPHENKHLLFVVFFLLGDSRASKFYVEQTQCSKMSAHKIHMPGNHPKERIQHSEHGRSLKSRIYDLVT
jgi:hypothetical protein